MNKEPYLKPKQNLSFLNKPQSELEKNLIPSTLKQQYCAYLKFVRQSTQFWDILCCWVGLVNKYSSVWNGNFISLEFRRWKNVIQFFVLQFDCISSECSLRVGGSWRIYFFPLYGVCLFYFTDREKQNFKNNITVCVWVLQNIDDKTCFVKLYHWVLDFILCLTLREFKWKIQTQRKL